MCINTGITIKMSKKATMNENFVKRSTKKDKGKNTLNKYGKYSSKYIRMVENSKINQDKKKRKA